MSYDRYMTVIYPVLTFWGFQMPAGAPPPLLLPQSRLARIVLLRNVGPGPTAWGRSSPSSQRRGPQRLATIPWRRGDPPRVNPPSPSHSGGTPAGGPAPDRCTAALTSREHQPGSGVILRRAESLRSPDPAWPKLPPNPRARGRGARLDR